MPLSQPLLETHGLTAFYGDFQALYGIDTVLEAGETVAIIGANGAGKSTYLKAIAGLIRGPADSIMLDGQPVGSRNAAEIVRLGIALVPEGRRLFPSLSVEENLLIGGHGRKAGAWTLTAHEGRPGHEGRALSVATERRDRSVATKRRDRSVATERRYRA